MLARVLRLPSITSSMRYMSTCGPLGKMREAQTQLTTLDNGLRIATQETYEECGAVTMMIETGPRFETPENNGINHFIEHMVYKGFRSMNRCQVEQLALFSSMRLTAKTTQEVQWFQIVCPSACIPCALDILAKVIDEPMFCKSEMKNEQLNLNLQFHDVDLNPRKLAFENLLRTAFQGTPLGQTVTGPTKNVREFDTAAVLKYVQEQYEPWRIVFSVSGKIAHEQVVSAVAMSLGRMPVCSMVNDFRPSRYTASEMNYRDDSIGYGHVCLAVEAPGPTSDKYLSMLLMKNLIGAWDKSLGIGGPMPELAKRCCDTDLCVRYESFYIPFSDVGLWGIYFVSDTHDVEDMIYNIQEIWKYMCTTTYHTELTAAKQWTLLEIAKERAGAAKASLSIARDIMFWGQRRHLTYYEDQINSIKDAKKICLDADEIIVNRDPVVAGVGCTEGISEYNRLSSGMYWLRW